MNSRILAITRAVSFLGVLGGCAKAEQQAELDKTKQLEQVHLATFDDLDFNVFSGRKWDQLNKSHATDITVHWPDGRTTKGIDTHIEDLKGMFVYAPDTRIKEHPIKLVTPLSGRIDRGMSDHQISRHVPPFPTGKNQHAGENRRESSYSIFHG